MADVATVTSIRETLDHIFFLRNKIDLKNKNKNNDLIEFNFNKLPPSV